jgi:sugar phosphate isomerase/epimerase
LGRADAAQAPREVGAGRGLERLAMTTVCLRDRIPFHSSSAAPTTETLVLEDAPGFIHRTFGLTNVELWSLQFQAESDDYCRLLRSNSERAGCRICNIQLDGRYDLSSPDADERQRSIEFAQGWIRRAALVGSPSIRVNLDSGRPQDAFVPELLVPIYRQLGNYGATLGVRILIENHIGLSRSIPTVARLLALVQHDNVSGLLDWGNSQANDLEQRLAEQRLLFPRLYLVSAKGLHFDAAGCHVEYPIRPLVIASERAGFRGLYSIELFTDKNPPDPIMAVEWMIDVIADTLQASRTASRSGN